MEKGAGVAGPWLVSYVVLWLLVLALAAAVLSHSRLLGVLHHRLAPSAAKPLSDGPPAGARLTGIEAQSLDGGTWQLRFPSAQGALVLFISPLCESCQDLIPHALDFADGGYPVPLYLVSTLGDIGMNRAFVRYRKLDSLIYLIGERLAEDLAIRGTPYALFLDSQGVVRRKGVVNHLEHLRSLVEPELELKHETTQAG